MKIKCTFEVSVVTNRRYIIRQATSGKQIACAECGEPMLRVEQAADLFRIKQRRIFQIIENETVHFTEIEAGAVMICLTSLAEILDGRQTLHRQIVAGEKRRHDRISFKPPLEINK